MARGTGLLTAINGSGIDAEGKEVIIDFYDERQEIVQIRLKEAVIDPLILVLLKRKLELGQEAVGGEFDVSLLLLEDVRALSLANGEAGLQFLLGSNLQVSVSVSQQARTAFPDALSTYDKIAAAPPPESKMN
jgi:hypothetical protein